ncbi:MAG: nuclear transport factor 2 family protein [Deltaproteobacteria bacterium]|nr:nuclear transport factor 2 family protein [Deltaproteobacteria bacterium]
MVALISCEPTNIKINSYAEDRAQIEDLQARYMFALDFGDADTYLSTFTEDGILDIVGMKWEGRENIRKIFERTPQAPPEGEETRAMESPSVGEEESAAVPPEGEEKPAAEEAQALYPATGRHNITNIVLKIDGDNAVGRAYWFHYGNNNPERKATLDSYGHYEDEMVKVNGEWLFSKRVIYNEQMAEWIGPTENPSW